MENFVPTRCSQTKKNATSDYISMNYEAPKKKTRSADDLDKRKLKDIAEPKLTPAELKEQQEKEMKKARFDIIKFGMSGFEKPKARRAKIELAISLGAIPPKNRRNHYNVIKMRRQKEKERQKEEQHVSGFKRSLRKPKSKTVRKKDSGILGVYGKITKDTLKKKKN